VPAQTAGASGKQTCNHSIMGGRGGEGPISYTTTIVDRATDMTKPENMEAETLQPPDSAPMPQKDETG